MARIRFKPEAMDRVRRERHWGLVEEREERDGIAVTLLDFSVEWLTGWVLSFGALAEVLEPDRLKKLVAIEAEKVAAQYAPVMPLLPLPVRLDHKRPRSAARLAKVS